MSTVRIGIVSWNTADLLDRCLASVPAGLDGMEAEVVVVDNASTDDSADRAEQHAGVEVIRSATNDGYARGMNRALAGTSAPVLLALNPDTEVPPGALRALVEQLLAQPDVGLVAPRLVGTDGVTQHTAYRFPSLPLAATVGFAPRRWLRGSLGRRSWLEGAADHEQVTDVEWTIGAVHVIRAEALGTEQPYDETWFMYAEDIELCWRLSAGGWRRQLEGGITVTHVGNAAGAKAWGEDRERVHLAASLGWMARDRGELYARAWSALNALALVVRPAGDGPRRRRLARWLVHHALTGVATPPRTRPA